jgi:hypothetical protein
MLLARKTIIVRTAAAVIRLPQHKRRWTSLGTGYHLPIAHGERLYKSSHKAVVPNSYGAGMPSIRVEQSVHLVARVEAVSTGAEK